MEQEGAKPFKVGSTKLSKMSVTPHNPLWDEASTICLSTRFNCIAEQRNMILHNKEQVWHLVFHLVTYGSDAAA